MSTVVHVAPRSSKRAIVRAMQHGDKIVPRRLERERRPNPSASHAEDMALLTRLHPAAHLPIYETDADRRRVRNERKRDRRARRAHA